ncbi:hypothetical protein ABL78_1869 [Leptomonas seymouri]|uniref:RING-type domain-containing protein n=1 Tax=Leptomonas seymouri TaxID=5684 RepID=A0A0N0P7Q9_LEPSE|nr:hypothetical protein ABL78_1869 [Leptomonas seymouri]|eukprot:KPI89056.1 hypothetical protein ABL78_1869 [Leptomonas seymouri]
MLPRDVRRATAREGVEAESTDASAPPPPFSDLSTTATAQSQSTTAGRPTRKRSRTATASRFEVEVEEERENSVISVDSEAPTVITVEDDSRSASEPARAPGASRCSRQTTLTGDVVGTAGMAAPAASSDGTVGGRRKPPPPARASTARTSKLKDGASSTATAPPLDDPAAAPMWERALLAHLRNALVLHAVKSSQRTIGLTTMPSAAQRTDAMDAYAVSGEATEDSAAAQSPPRAEDEPSTQTTPTGTDKSKTGGEGEDAYGVQGLLALPCVQYFIVEECARVARVVREDGGNGYDDDPVKRSLELLGLLLSMLDAPSSFATLMVLACPSCRSIGIGAESVSMVIQYLVLSQRVKREDVLSMSQAKALEVLGLHNGCRDDAGVPVEPLRCCPYGEAHVSLQLLLAGWASTHGSLQRCSLRCSLVPFQVDGLPGVSEAAKHYYWAYEGYTTTEEKKYHEQLLGRPPSAAMSALRRRQSHPPELQAKTLALLASRAGGATWAEAVFSKIFSDTVVPGMQHLRCSELQARIRTVYAYTQADVLGRGGYFKMTLNTLSSCFRGQAPPGAMVESGIVFLQHLFSFMKVFQHLAEGILHCEGGSGHCHRCLCGSNAVSSNPSFLLVEEHTPYVAALRRCREEQYLLVDGRDEVAEATLSNSQLVIDVDAEEAGVAAAKGNGNHARRAAAPVGGDVSYYSAGSLSRFYAMLDLVGHMHAKQVVDYVARVTADSIEPLPDSAVPRAYIHAELKRHQLEDVQWMWNKETEGYREHIQVPLYRVDINKAAQRPLVERMGTMFYCATANEIIVERGAATRNAQWSATGTWIRGGLLCDDVGLGKTLSVLTLCAYDRVMRESGAAGPDEDDALDAVTPSCPNRFWHLVARHGAQRTPSLAFIQDILRWGFGPGTFHAGTALHAIRPIRLPRTTLVVVPLSIVSQWIDELHQFYPAASYILFYGARRTQYNVQHLQQADFVLTTYETLSTHLRQETNGLHYWLSRNADAADDKTCAEAASRGWHACRPSHLYKALQTFASSIVWPQLSSEAEPHFLNFNRSRGFVLNVHSTEDAEVAQRHQRERGRGGGGRGGRGRGRNAAPNAGHPQDDGAPLPQLNTWTSEYHDTLGIPGFHCPAFSVYVSANGNPMHNAGEHRPSQSAAYRRLCTDAPHRVSDVFLDSLWALLKGYSASTRATPEMSSYSMHVGLFDAAVETPYTEAFLALLFRAEARYPMPDPLRRSFVAHVLLPSLWQPLETYWAEMKPHYTAVASAELTRQMPMRIVDLLFHRVVLDESQKCSANSFFHLLLGERRWAVTGTPLNNNKTESLGAALSFLGMNSAAQILSRASLDSLRIDDSWIPRHTHPSQAFLHAYFSRAVQRAVTRLKARLRTPFALDQESQEAHFCLCALCTQGSAYGIAERTSAVVPLECRRKEGRHQPPGGSPCLPNTLMEILALAMVRHERNQQVSRELQLPPVRYSAHRADLSADETQLYRRVAQVIMQVASRLHRQGVLSSRMSYALQWVQELCRLCLHPSRVGDAQLLRGNIEAHVLRAAQTALNESSPDPADFAASVAATFITVTAQEALDWAQSLAANNAERAQATFKVQAAVATTSGNSTHLVPEETVTALNDLKADPPLLPVCGVCMDDMVAPTLLNCFHMFCKECVIGVIDASRSFAGNVTAKCPYCRNRKSLLEEKRVITTSHGEEMHEGPPLETALEASDASPGTPTTDEVDAALVRIGDGSRVCAFVNLVKQIWVTEPGDGVLVFSKYPTFLQLAHDAIQAAGYVPHIVRGASTLAQRQRVMQALQQPGCASPVPHRILFVTSRSANAGLNLTFANHVIFLEPNVNPAMEQQAVGRVHRFGQLKQVTVHHLYAPRTIEEVIYHRSVRLREDATQPPAANTAAAIPAEIDSTNDTQRRTQFGRIAPAEISLLLEYPVPPPPAPGPGG